MKQCKAFSPAIFQSLILDWYDHHGRKDLPWQKMKSPYSVWISEIMLQQTQVSTVIPYFIRFMERFPNIASLAAADENEVLHYWAGLGYYQRAKCILKAALVIMDQFSGEVPADLTSLEQLPGIGRSTAGAILSLAFNQPAAILDGNVKRLFARMVALPLWPGEKKAQEALWSMAERYKPNVRAADYTQAVMDLGATLCTRAHPNCERCPLMSYCMAYAQGKQNQLPCPRPTKKMPIRNVNMLIIKSGHYVLLEKRSGAGVWKGLWSVPEVEGGPLALNEIKQMSAERFNIKINKCTMGAMFRHTFTHFHLDIVPIYLNISPLHKKRECCKKSNLVQFMRPAAAWIACPYKQIIK